eukprot:1818928-Amphidinium_carterae.1
MKSKVFKRVEARQWSSSTALWALPMLSKTDDSPGDHREVQTGHTVANLHAASCPLFNYPDVCTWKSAIALNHFYRQHGIATAKVVSSSAIFTSTHSPTKLDLGDKHSSMTIKTHHAVQVADCIIGCGRTAAKDSLSSI